MKFTRLMPCAIVSLLTPVAALASWSAGMGPDHGRTNGFPCVGQVGE